MSVQSDSSLHEDDPIAAADYEDIGSNVESNDEREVENDNEHNDEGNEEAQTKKRIDPTAKRVVRNPMVNLNTERLKGPKGIRTIEKYFEGFQFHGKGHEKTDLNRVMKRLEHWSHRLFPKLNFDDFLDKTEKLGAKKELRVFLTKYRQDMITLDTDIILPDDNEENQVESAPMDAFDKLIAEQIEKQKQATKSLENSMLDSSIDTNIHDIQNSLENQTRTEIGIEIGNKSTDSSSQLTDEIKAKIERNRQEAIKRRLARLHASKEESKQKKLDLENAGNENSQVENNEEASCNDKIIESSMEISETSTELTNAMENENAKEMQNDNTM